MKKKHCLMCILTIMFLVFGTFAVDAGKSIPKIKKITPSTLKKGEVKNITIKGKGFDSGTVVNIKGKIDVLFTKVKSKKKISKLTTYKKVLKEFKVKPDEVLCVGDRINDEIFHGNKLGMTTVRIKKGKYKDKKPKNKLEKANKTINNLSEIIKILKK